MPMDELFSWYDQLFPKQVELLFKIGYILQVAESPRNTGLSQF